MTTYRISDETISRMTREELQGVVNRGVASHAPESVLAAKAALREGRETK